MYMCLYTYIVIPTCLFNLIWLLVAFMHTCSLACVILSQLVQNEFGETPLIAASHQGHLTTAALLLDHGADVNKQRKVRLLFVCP